MSTLKGRMNETKEGDDLFQYYVTFSTFMRRILLALAATEFSVKTATKILYLDKNLKDHVHIKFIV